MTLLSTVSKPKQRAPIITIMGDAGTGKNSLAATFPKPIVLRIEDGVHRQHKAVPLPDAFPTVKAEKDIWDQLLALLNEDHDYQTLIVDSVTAAEEIFIREILDRDGKAKGINQALGGYGNGPSAVSAAHGRIRKAAGLLNERKGMTIVFIAHTDLENVRLPDMDDFQRYSLRLMPKSISPYIDNVDIVCLVRLAAALRGGDDERKKVVSNGDREMICYSTAASVTKNGLGIDEAIDLEPGVNPFAEYFGWGAPKAGEDKADGEKPKRQRRVKDPDADEDQPDGNV